MRNQQFVDSIKRVNGSPYCNIYRVCKPLTVYKKAAYARGVSRSTYSSYAIIKLEIPARALIYYPGDRFAYWSDVKMRASSAKVISITNYLRERNRWSSWKTDKARSSWSPSFVYEVGKTVRPRDKFSRAEISCGSGIHFFRTLEHARSYNI